MTVQWFPGHMAKALRMIEEEIKKVDFVIECRDARAPHSTRNPVLAKRIADKPRLIVLTKKDLADPKESEKWVTHLEKEGYSVLLLNTLKDPVNKLIMNSLENVLIDKRNREKKRGMKRRKDRALIVGVPNVGKSTIINQLARKKATVVENRPGVTQALKLVQVNPKLELVDTPGVLWPKFESVEMGYHCALIASVKESGFELEHILPYAYNKMNLSTLNYPDFIEKLARDQGLIMKDNEVDRMATQKLLYRRIFEGYYGPMTWDKIE